MKKNIKHEIFAGRGKKKGNGKKNSKKKKKGRNNGSSYWVILLCTFMTKEIGENLNNIKKNKKE